jgi:hypothetical protein
LKERIKIFMVNVLRFGLICLVGVVGVLGYEKGVEDLDGEELEVPFTSQAPEKNWYEPWLNACEETSILMVDAFYDGDGGLSVEEAKSEILEIIRVKEVEFDVSLDESLETMVGLIDELDLGWSGYIKEAPSLQDLKIELESGRPVIVPVYAPELGNPYYTGGGPDYHVVVLKGYDEERNVFVVNDPGTQFGEGLEFSYETLMRSVHDLNQDDYDSGRKRVLFTER